MFDLDRLCMGCMGDNDGQEICPICGFDKQAPTPPHALELKTVLQQRYIVGKMLIYGGDGITYLGFDKLDEKVVRIKEYYPGGVCQRKDGVGVRVKKESAFAYNSGIMDFLDLSEKLETLLDVSGIYPVVNVFEENGTAYRITEYTPGINLRDYLLRNGGTLTWEQAKPLFMPLMQAIIRLHKAGIVHRAISPETIIVGRDGKLKLIDFSISSVRTTKGDLAPQLYAGYAAIEQYGHAKTTDGEWTDVYGLAATMFKALIGNPPIEATQRLENDNMSFPKRLAEEIPHNVLIALANALQIMPDDRTGSVAEFIAELSDDDDEVLLVVADEPKAKEKKAVKKGEKTQKPKIKKSDKMMAIKAGAITIGALIVIALIVVFAFFGDSIFSKPNIDDTASIESLTSVETVSIASNTVSHAEKLYEVPDLSGKTYADIEGNVAYKGIFTYKVGSKQYSDTVAKGKIISQTPTKGSSVVKDTEISVVISLGPEKVNIPYLNKTPTTKIDAYVALLELGIEPSAIEFMETAEGDSIEAGCVVKTQPEMGTKIGRDSQIIVFIKKADPVVSQVTPSSEITGTDEVSSEITNQQQ